MSQIYDARTGTYIRGGSSSADPGGQSVYHVDDWQNASSYKDSSNPKSVFYPDESTKALSNVVQDQVAGSYDNPVSPGYSQLIDGFLGALNTGNGYLHDLVEGQLNLAERNSALSQEMADKANLFSHDEAVLARAWSGQQAKMNRDWQTEMSNTAHQREVSDLIAAGLNPILSANNGASTGNSGVPGASMAQSHQGQVDTTSAYGMATNLMQSMISSAVQLKSLDVEQAMQDKSIALARDQMENDINRSVISGQYTERAAQAGAYGTIVASENSAEVSRFRSETDREIAKLNNETQRINAKLNAQIQRENNKLTNKTSRENAKTQAQATFAASRRGNYNSSTGTVRNLAEDLANDFVPVVMNGVASVGNGIKKGFSALKNYGSYD